MPYTTTNLLADVQRDSYGGTAQGNFDPVKLLKIGDDEMHSTVIPLLLSLKQNYYLETLVGTFVPGQADYPLPSYAMYNTIKDVERLSGGYPIPLTRLLTNNLFAYNNQGAQYPTGFYIESDIVTFVPIPQSTENYRFWYYRRPGRMVDTALAAQVQSVNYVTGEVTYTTTPPATYTASSTHDFYSSTPPFRRIGTAVQATAIAANVQTFPAISVATLQPGDYVCVLNETVYPPLPLELQPFLKELICLRISQTSADQTAYALNKDRITSQMRAALITQVDRSDGHPEGPSLFDNTLVMQLITF